jgi:hypothetical protein
VIGQHAKAHVMVSGDDQHPFNRHISCATKLVQPTRSVDVLFFLTSRRYVSRNQDKIDRPIALLKGLRLSEAIGSDSRGRSKPLFGIGS